MQVGGVPAHPPSPHTHNLAARSVHAAAAFRKKSVPAGPQQGQTAALSNMANGLGDCFGCPLLRFPMQHEHFGLQLWSLNWRRMKGAGALYRTPSMAPPRQHALHVNAAALHGTGPRTHLWWAVVPVPA